MNLPLAVMLAKQANGGKLPVPDVGSPHGGKLRWYEVMFIVLMAVLVIGGIIAAVVCD